MGLARVWAAVDRDYVNYDRLAIDWDSAFVATLPEVDRTTSTLEYYRTLARLVASVGDGHTKISLPADVRAVAARTFPLRTRLIEEEVVVTEVRNDSLYAAGIRPGMVVREIDGEPALYYGRRHVMPYQASSTTQDRLLRTYDYELFRGPADEPVRLLLTDVDGRPRRVVASRRLPWNRSAARSPVELHVLPGDIGHLRLRRFDTEQVVPAFDSLYARILDTEALVIDVRDNGGGSSRYGYYILSHLVDRPFPGTHWISRHRVSKFAAGDPEATYYLRRQRMYEPAETAIYRGDVVLLINEATFSAAEDFAAIFDYVGRGPVVGTASGGSSGEPILTALPGGGRLRVCTERPAYPDGREFVGVGVVPDIEAAPTIRGVAAGRDEVLEAALALLRD